ncbi:hypothetical protein D3C80_1898580 [compost metagenome]
MQHGEHPTDEHDHEQRIGQAGKEYAKVEGQRLNVARQQRELLDWHFHDPVPQRDDNLVEIQTVTQRLDR